MPCTLDAKSNYQKYSGTSSTWNHTVAAGANYMVLGFTVNSTSTPTVTFDGVGMTQIAAIVEGSAHAFFYELNDPHVGTKAFSVSSYVTGYFFSAAASFLGASVAAVKRTTLQYEDLAYHFSTASLTTPAKPMDCSVDFVGGQAPGSAWGVSTATNGGIKYSDNDDNQAYLFAAAQYNVGNTSLSWTFTGANNGPCRHWGFAVLGLAGGSQAMWWWFKQYKNFLRDIRSMHFSVPELARRYPQLVSI